jgi:CRP-like cAMP-binding protein
MALLARARTSIRKVDRRETLIVAGSCNSSLVLIRQGWAGRICEDTAGRRLIIDLLLPGDICGLEAMALGHATHTVKSLTAVEVERFDVDTVSALAADEPQLATALLHHSIRQTATARANQTRGLKRAAAGRLADLIYTLTLRMNGSASSNVDPEIPLTQFDLADATGLTAIHVNRALRDLRTRGVIAIDRRKLRVVDLPALRAIIGILPAATAG